MAHRWRIALVLVVNSLAPVLVDGHGYQEAIQFGDGNRLTLWCARSGLPNRPTLILGVQEFSVRLWSEVNAAQLTCHHSDRNYEEAQASGNDFTRQFNTDGPIYA
jgi:hypothetical protein